MEYRDDVKTQQIVQEQFRAITEPPVPFSVPDYLDRMEKLHLKAMQERENEQAHIIVLWWGFDGLRLNADGTMEWISRRPKEEKPTFLPTHGCTYEEFSTIAGDMFSVPYLTIYDSANDLQPTTLGDCSATWKIQSTEERIAALQSQLQAVNMQQWQNEQIQSMINIIEPGRDINGRLRRRG